MKKCLAEEPTARGTFENVMEDLSVHRSGCSGKQAQKLEEQLVRLIEQVYDNHYYIFLKTYRLHELV